MPSTCGITPAGTSDLVRLEVPLFWGIVFTEWPFNYSTIYWSGFGAVGG